MDTYCVYNDIEKRLEFFHKGTLVQSYENTESTGDTYVVCYESPLRFEIYINGIIAKTYYA